ncbi:L,D-transpeptidase family protein [Streptomyces sp. NPDC059740]|uniref:L,D-transpeptidase family protein n=1 Tax=Streptomyces sp. NPDC059740 TaxID=3346926 RepID=UPI003652ACF1
MRTAGSVVRTVAALVGGVALVAGCGTGDGGGHDKGGAAASSPKAAGATQAAPTTHLAQVPDVDALQKKIPADSRQVVAVYGKGVDSPDATVALYVKGAKGWDRKDLWSAHNGKRGWTTDHHEGDKRSPVGVFGLTDAGGVLPSPGTKLPYSHSAAFTPPSYWAKSTRHDFDYVVAINYNRTPGTSPLDPGRPLGQSKGGGIWLHLDHGSGTSGCVSLPKPALRTLLGTLDPAAHPVVVMGDKGHLAA